MLKILIFVGEGYWHLFNETNTGINNPGKNLDIPLTEGTLKNNLGLPIVVVLNKVNLNLFSGRYHS